MHDSDKRNVMSCLRCSVLSLCSLHRQIDQSSSSLVGLASVIERVSAALPGTLDISIIYSKIQKVL